LARQIAGPAAKFGKHCIYNGFDSFQLVVWDIGSQVLVSLRGEFSEKP
jgi:hypothetical protein